MFAIEYHNHKRRAEHRGRFFKRPDAEDLARAEAAAERWKQLSASFVPDDLIPPGDETEGYCQVLWMEGETASASSSSPVV